jgi:hypothetical protein
MDGISAVYILRRLLDDASGLAGDIPESPSVLRSGTARGVLAGLGQLVLPALKPTVKQPTGSRRHLAWTTLPRADMERQRHEGATLNDVYLALVPGAVAQVTDLRSGRYPVFAGVAGNVRASKADIRLGQGAQLFRLKLPVNHASFPDRLEAVRRQTQAVKKVDVPASLAQVHKIACSIGGGAAAGLIRKFGYSTLFADLLCSNVPIMAGPWTFLGRPVLGVYFVPPLPSGCGLSVGMHGHAETVTLGILAHSSCEQAADGLAWAIAEELATLTSVRA